MGMERKGSRYEFALTTFKNYKVQGKKGTRSSSNEACKS
jgi:hypothetical protein